MDLNTACLTSAIVALIWYSVLSFMAVWWWCVACDSSLFRLSPSFCILASNKETPVNLQPRQITSLESKSWFVHGSSLRQNKNTVLLCNCTQCSWSLFNHDGSALEWTRTFCRTGQRTRMKVEGEAKTSDRSGFESKIKLILSHTVSQIWTHDNTW